MEGTLHPLAVQPEVLSDGAIGSVTATEMVAVFREPSGVSIGRIEAGSKLTVVDTTDGWYRVHVEGQPEAWVAENYVVFTPGDRSGK